MMSNIENESIINRENSYRKSVRYAHDNMFVTFSHSLIKIFQKPLIVYWMNINRHGTAFVSDHRYKTGSELLTELSIDGSNKKSLSGVVSTVTNIKEDSSNYRCGIMLNFDA